MFSTKIHDGEAFGAEQKICEHKKRISKLKRIKSKVKVITPTIPIKKSSDNMHQTESEKYGYAPNYREKNSLFSKNFRIVFDFERIKN